ncbi:MAG: fimbrillin family protein [Prevotella sp.]|nr:fimbrillin family protein [Prevotella sp.]MDD7074775.1 fimbrillin family protein [Prevotellaceae bacterium]MDY5342626.1 fimbrillin family protein [Prevotella sp.]
MRKIFNFAMVAVTAIFAGCANDEDALLPNDSLKDTPINVDVLVSGINTRAGYGNTSLPTMFYLSIDQKDTNYDYNVVMKYEGDTWVAYESADENAAKKQLLWEGSEANVTVTAATFPLPKTSTSCSLNVQTNQSTDDGIKASDHLCYYSNAVTPSTGGITLGLNHIMSKITVKLTLGTEYATSATNPITSVTAFGASTGATYSPGATTPWSAGSNVSKITLIPSVAYDTSNRTVTYEAILVPQTIAENTFGIEIRIGEKTYEWKSAAAFTLKGGTNHTLEMTVGNASSANIK